MTIPKMSIIVPVYNAAPYLPMTLKSLLAQKEEDVEIIIIDDGSTDISAQICKQYADADSRIKLVHKKNGGVSSARNRGIELAQGELITFVDADDWVDSDYCSTILREMQDSDMLAFDACMHRSDSIERVSLNNYGFFHDEDSLENALSEIHYPNNRLGWPWNKAFRRTIIQKARATFPEDLSLFEDEVFVLRYCAQVNSIRIIPQALYNYRITESSLTFQKVDANVLNKIANYIEDSAAPFKQRKFLSGLYWQALWLKIEAYKHQRTLSYKQFMEINHYYKKYLPLLRIIQYRKIIFFIFGRKDLASYALYMFARMLKRL